MLGFPEHRNVLTCPRQTLAILEFLSESWNFHQKFIHQDGVGQTGGCWDGPSSFLHIPPEVLGILRLGPRSLPERSGRGKCQPPELGGGSAEEYKCLSSISSGQQPFKNSFICIRAITKISSDSAWHITGAQKC